MTFLPDPASPAAKKEGRIPVLTHFLATFDSIESGTALSIRLPQMGSCASASLALNPVILAPFGTPIPG